MAVVVAGVLVAVGTGCSSAPPSDALDRLDALRRTPPTEVTTPPEATASAAIDVAPVDVEACERQTAEHYSLAPTPLPPAGRPEPGTRMAEIVASGRLVVGVDENTLGFGYRNPETGDIEGFEVDLAHEIAMRLFGPEYGPERVVLRPLVTGEKVSFVRDGKVDLTISAISMSCDRWRDVAFSAEYFTAHQELLVRRDLRLDSVADLAGRVVCVTAGSSSIGILARHAPDAERLEVPARTDCLMALQQGDADAYFGHDSFLYGMLLQDPTVEVRAGIIPAEETVSHYGIAISHDHPELVRFVNAVLEDVDATGAWQQHYADLQQTLRRPGGGGLPDASPPERRYRAEG